MGLKSTNHYMADLICARINEEGKSSKISKDNKQSYPQNSKNVLSCN